MLKTAKKYDVIALGVAVVDMTAYPVDRSLFERDNTPVEKVLLAPGGDAVNQALSLSRLGDRVSLCCRLGDDSLGRFVLGEISGAGVKPENITLSADSVTSCAIVLVSKDGERNILCSKGNNYDFCISDINMDAIADTRALSVGSIYGIPKLEENGLTDVLSCAKKHGAVTFADMGSDKKDQRLDGLKPLLPYIDFFMPSDTESVHLTSENDPAKAAAIFKDCGAGGVIIKLGAKGAYADCPGFCGYITPFSISPLDTTGSGDAFCAGFIHSILADSNIPRALDFASACGAFAALSHGAVPSDISEHAIQHFIKTTLRRQP